MGYLALSWVWPREITPPARKLIAVALADQANDDGVCWPSHRKVAEKCCMSPETVRQHLRELEAQGIIERSARERKDGSQTSNEYRVLPRLEDTRGFSDTDEGGGTTPPMPGGSPPGETEPSVEPSTEPGAQGALLPDPVDDVWQHYVVTLDRPRAQLTPKVRRWIAAAIKAAGVERCKEAIDGLSGSDYHRQNGFVGIEYALVPKQNQTIESRIDMMASKATPRRPANEPTTVTELLRTVPSERHEIIHLQVDRVYKMQRSDRASVHDEGREALAWLREHPPFIEPVVIDGRMRGWRRVR